jgi:hypothetical protein
MDRVRWPGGTLFAGTEIPITPNLSEGERAMGFGQGIVQLNGFPGCRYGTAFGLSVGHERIFVQQQISVRQASIGMGVSRIVDDRLSKVVTCPVQAVGRSLVPFEAAL